MRSDIVYSLGSYLVSFSFFFFFLFHMFHCGTDTTLHSLPCVILGATYRIPNLEAEPVFSWRKKKKISWQQSKPFSYSFHPNSLEDVEVWSSKRSLQRCAYVCSGNLNILKTSRRCHVVIYFLLLCMVISIWDQMFLVSLCGVTTAVEETTAGKRVFEHLFTLLHFVSNASDKKVWWINPACACLCVFAGPKWLL